MKKNNINEAITILGEDPEFQVTKSNKFILISDLIYRRNFQILEKAKGYPHLTSGPRAPGCPGSPGKPLFWKKKRKVNKLNLKYTNNLKFIIKAKNQ